MKVAILAGGMGTRLTEETRIRPKPMVEIGGHPILWHIMMHYSNYGYSEFVIALGYRGDDIKRFIIDYSSLQGNIKVTLGPGMDTQVTRHEHRHPEWNVELIDTGISTLTGGRIKRLKPFLGETTFMLTWGDGISDIDLDNLLSFHKSHGKLATVTAVRPPARYGRMHFEGDRVTSFLEKPQTEEGWINGAFFVLEPGVLDYIEDDMTMWEYEPMERLAKDGQLMAYRHDGFWACMDTLRDKHRLQEMWDAGDRPWVSWGKK